ncbi:hypothetical protein Tco_0088639 [Tanacetum coccineum]
MSDSEDSTVTYTEISSPYEDLSDIGSPGAEGPIFQDPPSPDYVPGPEEPEQAPPSPICCFTMDLQDHIYYDSVVVILQQSDPLPLFYKARSRLIIEEPYKTKQVVNATTIAGTALLSTTS